MNTSRPWLIAAGLLLGLVGGLRSEAASAGQADCKSACACRKTCEDKLATCNAACDGSDKKVACLGKCNDALLKCLDKCPGQDCSCGGY
jgi:hypothetical protein